MENFTSWVSFTSLLCLGQPFSPGLYTRMSVLAHHLGESRTHIMALCSAWLCSFSQTFWSRMLSASRWLNSCPPRYISLTFLWMKLPTFTIPFPVPGLPFLAPGSGTQWCPEPQRGPDSTDPSDKHTLQLPRTPHSDKLLSFESVTF